EESQRVSRRTRYRNPWPVVSLTGRSQRCSLLLRDSERAIRCFLLVSSIRSRIGDLFAHHRKLPLHGRPLEHAYDHRTERKKSNCAGQPNDPALTTFDLILDGLKFVGLLLIAFSLCVLASRVVLQYWSLYAFSGALL